MALLDVAPLTTGCMRMASLRAALREPALWLFIAATTNMSSLAAQAWWNLHTRLFGRRAWLAHAVIILPAWAGFVVSVRSVRPGRRRWPLGRPIEGMGAILVGLGFLELGPASAINGDLFGFGNPRAQPGGIYRVMENPIYSGYGLLLFGRALRIGRVRLAIVAAESLLLLNAIEAGVERRARARTSALTDSPRRRKPAFSASAACRFRTP